MVMRPHLPALLVAIGSLGMPWASAQAPEGREAAPPWAPAVDRAIQREMEAQGAVGVAIGVIRDGRIAYLKGYGWADRGRREPVTTETVFNWASNSKPLAAVAAMQLVERGRLDLDADVRGYLPDYPDPDALITCRHLLCHQSGIPHYQNGEVIPTDREGPPEPPSVDPIRSLDRFNRSPLLFPPGERDSYSSYAYVLLSAVVQGAGEEQFDRQIRRRIAEPLGMDSLQLDGDEAGRAGWAVGYTKDQAGRVVRAPEEAHDWKFGAGGYKSNVRDFARWAEALIDRRLVGEAAERLMWTPQRTTGGEATTRGLGFTVEDQDGLKVSHNGQQPEASTRMVIYPEARHGVVVLCNCDFANPGAFSTAVYRAIAGAAEPGPDAAALPAGRPR